MNLNLPIKERLSFAHERFLDSSKLAPLQPQNSTATPKVCDFLGTPSFGFKQLRLLTLRFAKYCYPKMRSIFLRRSRKYQISKIAQDSSFLWQFQILLFYQFMKNLKLPLENYVWTILSF